MFKSPTIRSGGNAKTVKGDKGGVYETAIMYLAPARMAGGANICPMATQAGCDPTHGGGCLVKAGRAEHMGNINEARVRKTQRYLKDRASFMAELVHDIEAFVRYCRKRGVKPAVRLNGTSDIQWEVAHPCVRIAEWHMTDDKGDVVVIGGGKRYASIFEAFPEVQFYDYTKIYKRAYRALPSNYALTLSYSGASEAYANAVVNAVIMTGINIAVVYRTKAQRDSNIGLNPIGGTLSWLSAPVIDGDETDMRFTDPKGVVVGLYAKGPAKRDTSGFVVD